MARNIDVTLELDNKQYNRAIRQSEQQTEKFAGSAKSSFGGIATAFSAIASTAVVADIFRTGAAFQDLQTSLNVVFGSAQAGADAFARVQDFAASTQFSVQTLTQAFIQLKGAGVEPTQDLLQTFADTASVTTDQMGTFQAALDLVSRSTAGGLGLEDLNRLADRGIPVFRILQDRLGLARLEISEFGKTADGANQIISALLDGLQEDFGGALENQIGNINFELNQLGDAFDKLQNAIFTIFGESSADAVRGLADAINRLADNTEFLKTAMVGLATIITFIFNPFQKIGVAIGVVSKGFTGLFKNAGPLRRVFTQLKTNSENFFAVLKSKSKDFLGIGTGATKNSKALQGLSKTIDEGVESILRIGGAATVAVVASEALKDKTEEVTSETEELNEEIEDNATKLNTAAIAAKAFEKGYNDAKNAVKDLKKEVFDSNDPLSNYQTFLSDILSSSNRMAVEQVFAANAVATLKDFLDNGLISTRAYGFAMERLNGILGVTEEEVEENTDAFDAFNDIVDSIAKNTENYNMMLERLNELYTQGALSAEQFAEAKANLDQAFTENEALDNFLETLGRAQKTLSEDLATSLIEGKSVLDDFKNFFNKIITQIIADIIRLQIIQPILGALLSPFGFGFGTGGSIIKLPGKADGGPVMANKPYIVGERGPELFVPGMSGNIVPNDAMGGGSRVTYNINAVDARSFKQLVASDPEFIFNVTRAGARRQPAG